MSRESSPLPRVELLRRLLPLIPAGLLVQQVLPEPDRVVILSRPTAAASVCPLCGKASARVHSHHQRSLADLPWQGRVVVLRVRVRRFRCATDGCPRQVFAERLPEVVTPRARRTVRLAAIQHHIALALGGEAGSRLARRLTMPVGATTLLGMLRRTAPETPPQAPRVIGVDEWAELPKVLPAQRAGGTAAEGWRRGHRYGAILVDLERRRVVDLLPDRNAETLAAWLREHPGAEILSRDRSGAFADAARRAAPGAIQVADRWHLLENCSRALLEPVQRRRADVRAAAQPTAAEAGATREPPPMTSAEQRRWTRWRRQCEAYDEAVRLSKKGVSTKAIVRRLGVGRNTVRRWLRGAAPDPFHRRRSILEPSYAGIWVTG